MYIYIYIIKNSNKKPDKEILSLAKNLMQRKRRVKR